MMTVIVMRWVGIMAQPDSSLLSCHSWLRVCMCVHVHVCMCVCVCRAEVLKDGVRVWKDIYVSTEKHGECY